jgi:hypothetical protein
MTSKAGLGTTYSSSSSLSSEGRAWSSSSSSSGSCFRLRGPTISAVGEVEDEKGVEGRRGGGWSADRVVDEGGSRWEGAEPGWLELTNYQVTQGGDREESSRS